MVKTINDLALMKSGADIAHQAPLAVNFEYYLAQRPKVLAHSGKLPAYLLLPEVHRLLDATLNDRHRLLFNVLWQTGSRISEALAVRPKDLVLDNPMNSYVSLETLKRAAGRKKTVTRPSRRVVPIVNEGLLLELKRYIETHRCKRLSPLFDLSRQAVDNAIKHWAGQLNPPLSIHPSAHTLRHSFAVNHLLHGQSLKDISAWLGHTSLKTTLIYLNVLGSDTNHLAIRTQF